MTQANGIAARRGEPYAGQYLALEGAGRTGPRSRMGIQRLCGCGRSARRPTACSLTIATAKPFELHLRLVHVGRLEAAVREGAVGADEVVAKGEAVLGVGERAREGSIGARCGELERVVADPREGADR
jgi:hypothetical protein